MRAELQWTGANQIDMMEFLGSPRVGFFHAGNLYLQSDSGPRRVPQWYWVERGPDGAGMYSPDDLSDR